MNAVNTLVRPGPSDSADDHDVRDIHEVRDGRRESATENAGTAETGEQTPPGGSTRRATARLRDADGMAVASFVMGLAGLLVFNAVLGPCALVLGSLALLRGTSRRGRALLGLSLGAADLIVLAAVTAADQSFSWSLGG
ncbi:DUF4190 domain-containing protein [Streptomyces ovatisporus]|uniref:DUF4190 domain-containing protein n=1 Tax=Streptomyces ovatisporus TaxID=1128682 RepID=A0ABV9AAU1_9ACTN